MFCPNCGKELENGARFCGECGKEVAVKTSETTEQNVVVENTIPNKPKRGFKLIATVVIVVAVLLVVASRSDDRKVVYELIPEIFEAEDISLGYGKAIFPKYGSDGIEIVDLEYTEIYDGYTFEMYQVNGTVRITSAFGSEHDVPYQMKVGLEENFDDSGMYYYILEEGMMFW